MAEAQSYPRLSDDKPTLLKLQGMKKRDGKSLNVIGRIAAHYSTFGIHLLQDDNGDRVKLIERDHRYDGTEAITLEIIKKWLDGGGSTCTYEHLIDCIEKVRLGALAGELRELMAEAQLYPRLSDKPTLLKLQDMKNRDGKSLNVIGRIAGHYSTFGIHLLQDDNGDRVKLIERDHRYDGAEAITSEIIKKWIDGGGSTCTYEHLIECIEKVRLGALAGELRELIR